MMGFGITQLGRELELTTKLSRRGIQSLSCVYHVY